MRPIMRARVYIRLRVLFALFTRYNVFIKFVIIFHILLRFGNNNIRQQTENRPFVPRENSAAAQSRDRGWIITKFITLDRRIFCNSPTSFFISGAHCAKSLFFLYLVFRNFTDDTTGTRNISHRSLQLILRRLRAASM